MDSVWRSLLCKEWREQRCILALMIAGCILIGLLFVAIEWDWRASIAGPGIVLGFGVPATAIFVGAGIAARERSRGTLGFLQALPTTTKKAAGAKLLAASATVMAPAVLACLVLAVTYLFRVGYSTFWLPDPELDRFPVELLKMGFAALVSGAAAVSLLVWTAAPGVNHVDELRAGAIGLLTIAVVWGAILATFTMIADNHNGSLPAAAQRGFELVSTAAPAGIFAGVEMLDDRRWIAHPWQRSWPLALAFLASHGALAAWYVLRFGRRAKPQAAGESVFDASSTAQWLGAPRRSRTTAIVWKQFRESAPLAAMGGLAVFILSPAVAGMTWSIAKTDYFETWHMTALTTWLMAGVFVAVVAGIGLFYEDLRPGLHTFWRSRPINVDAWYWIKLVTGVTITVGVFAAGPLLSFAALSLTGHAAIVDLPSEPYMARIFGGGLLLHSTTLVLAAFAIIVVRQLVMAAMLTFVAGIAIAVPVVAWMQDSPPHLGALVALGVCLLVGISLVACVALRRDWGWGGAN